MNKIRLLALSLLVAVVALPTFSGGSLSALQLSYPQAVAGADGNSMKQVRLIIWKMTNLAVDMKDFDKLEADGVAKQDVDRIRRIMKEKVKRLSSEAGDLIRAL